jgi:hypothetical protein
MLFENLLALYAYKYLYLCQAILKASTGFESGLVSVSISIAGTKPRRGTAASARRNTRYRLNDLIMSQNVICACINPIKLLLSHPHFSQHPCIGNSDVREKRYFSLSL